jgi:hypothetical protein
MFQPIWPSSGIKTGYYNIINYIPSTVSVLVEYYSFQVPTLQKFLIYCINGNVPSEPV